MNWGVKVDQGDGELNKMLDRMHELTETKGLQPNDLVALQPNDLVAGFISCQVQPVQRRCIECVT